MVERINLATMEELSTLPSDVQEYLATISNEDRLEDCLELIKWMMEITGEQPKIWQKSIVGFGSYHYKYESGREGDWILTGFSSRKANLSVYIISGFNQHTDLLEQLGKHKTGASCLYIKNLDSIDTTVLKNIIRRSVEVMKTKY